MEWPERVQCHHGIRPQEAKLTEWWSCLVNNVARKPTSVKVLPTLLSVHHLLIRNDMQHHPQSWKNAHPKADLANPLQLRQEATYLRSLHTGHTAHYPSEELTHLTSDTHPSGYIPELLPELLCSSLASLHHRVGVI